MPVEIEIADEQNRLALDEEQLAEAARRVLAGEGIASGTVSLAVVDDRAMHDLNRQYLSHDYPTDVLSFVLERSGAHLEGEVIVSADTALASAEKYGWRAHDELLLYVIHGCLHLAGHDDQTDDALATMRDREKKYLSLFGLTPRYE